MEKSEVRIQAGKTCSDKLRGFWTGWRAVLVEAGLIAAVAIVAGAASNLLRSEATKLAWIPAHSAQQASARAVAAPPPSPASGTEIAPKTERKQDAVPGPAAKNAAAAPVRTQPAGEGTRSKTPPADPRTIAPPKDPSELYLEIAPEMAQRLHQAGALFIDARRSSIYEGGHIQGARNIAVWEHDADTRIVALQQEGVSFDQVIVVYCSGRECEDSHKLSHLLALAGFINIYIYKEGYPDWGKRGWPVKRGNLP